MRKFIPVILSLTVLFSCKKASSPNDEHEHEAINKVEFLFSQGGVLVSTFIVEDPDGDGGNPPTRLDTIKLIRNQTYILDVKVKNISSGTERDITPKIILQGKSHEMFYIPSGVSIIITKNDRDANNFPLGLNSTWQVGGAGLGTVLVKLMHKTGIKGPNDSPDKGHSDLQVVVPVKII